MSPVTFPLAAAEPIVKGSCALHARTVAPCDDSQQLHLRDRLGWRRADTQHWRDRICFWRDLTRRRGRGDAYFAGLQTRHGRQAQPLQEEGFLS